MGSNSDLRVMQDAAKVLSDFSVPFDLQVVSAHRTPKKMSSFAQEAATRYSMIIAGAGGAAHLPGMVAAFSTLPVIGVPIQVGKLKGLDALLSIAQMPRGVPVACMAVDNATNAALLAVRILAATASPRLGRALVSYQRLQAKIGSSYVRAKSKKKK